MLPGERVELGCFYYCNIRDAVLICRAPWSLFDGAYGFENFTGGGPELRIHVDHIHHLVLIENEMMLLAYIRKIGGARGNQITRPARTG